MIKRLDYVDNLFDDDFVARVATKYHDNLFYYGNVSNNPDDAIFWCSKRLNDYTHILDCPDQKFIFSKIKEYYKFDVKEKDLDKQHVYINGQTYELDGSMHIDSLHRTTNLNENYTILYMVNYLHEGIKGFETQMGVVDFVPGRVVIFSSMMPHRGLSTSVKTNCRMTLTWKSFDLVFDKDSPIML